MVPQYMFQAGPLSLWDYFMMDFFKNNPSTWETTSFDGKPFLNPIEFFELSNHQPQKAGCSSLESMNKTAAKIKSSLKNDSQKINNKAKTIQIDHNTIDSDSDVEIIANPKKKVKTNKGGEIVADQKLKQGSGVVPVICLSPTSPTTKGRKKGKKGKEETNAEGYVVMNDKEVPKKLKDIIKTIYDSNGKLHYIVKCERISDKKELTVMMSREDVISQDSTLLVYYYEKYLQFDKMTDFNPSTLEKL